MSNYNNYHTTDLVSLGRQFGAIVINSSKEGLLGKEDARNQLLHSLAFNVDHYENDSWDKGSILRKCFKDLNREQALFSLRLGSKTLFKSLLQTPTREAKLAYLHGIIQVIENKDPRIEKMLEDYCADKVNRKAKRKEEKRLAMRELRQQRKIAEMRNAEEEEARYSPRCTY